MRIIDRFEERFLGFMAELMTEDELEQCDHQISPVFIPKMTPAGQMQPELGFHLAVARRTVVLDERLVMTDVCQDPYLSDAELKQKVKAIITELAEAISRQNGGHANGAASAASASGLIIPGRG